jgi:ubiquinone/menaquinone biosynthesis C-methylase UbiE
MSNWEAISSSDPLYGIASSDDKKNKKWELDEFFQRGEGIMKAFMGRIEKLNYPKERNVALEFGCGAGRLLRFASPHFQKVIGIDISDGMIDLAKKYQASYTNIEYHVNKRPDLSIIRDSSVDFIYTHHVLQHVPKKSEQIAFIKEFQRIMTQNGLMAFHIPVFLPVKNRLQARRRLYKLLNTIGFSSKFLMNKLGLYPIHMKPIPREEILSLFDDRFVLLEEDKRTDKSGVVNITFYFTRKS